MQASTTYYFRGGTAGSIPSGIYVSGDGATIIVGDGNPWQNYPNELTAEELNAIAKQQDADEHRCKEEPQESREKQYEREPRRRRCGKRVTPFVRRRFVFHGRSRLK